MSKPSFYTVIEYLTNPMYEEYDRLPEEVKSSYSQWMLNQTLSQLPMFADQISKFSKYKVSDQRHFRFLWTLLPKQHLRIPPLQKQNEDLKDIRDIMKEFQLGYRDAKIIHNQQRK